MNRKQLFIFGSLLTSWKDAVYNLHYHKRALDRLRSLGISRSGENLLSYQELREERKAILKCIKYCEKVERKLRLKTLKYLEEKR